MHNSPQNPISQLPPATMTGENTFSFLLNGEPINSTHTFNQVAIYQQGQLQFGGGGILIVLGDPLIQGNEYSIINQAEYLGDPNQELGCHYNFTDTYRGSILFSKIDRVNYLISGTFESSTTNVDCENTDITNGRFDLQYLP